MKKRLRKKKGKILDEELWNFDVTICKWIIPRLKRFKEINIAYPGTEEFPTPESWDEALDKMIHSFELALYDPIDLDENLKPAEYDKYDHEKYTRIAEKYEKELKEGLHLFAENFWNLWI